MFPFLEKYKDRITNYRTGTDSYYYEGKLNSILGSVNAVYETSDNLDLIYENGKLVKGIRPIMGGYQNSGILIPAYQFVDLNSFKNDKLEFIIGLNYYDNKPGFPSKISGLYEIYNKFNFAP